MIISRLKSIILGNWGGRVALTSIVVSSLILILRQLGAFEGAELRSYDSLIRARKVRPLDDRLLIVTITEDDLKSRQEAFIYDQTLADAMKKLQQYRPALIGLDIDRSIPMPKGKERLNLAQQLQQPNVVAVCALSGLNFEGSPPPPEISPQQVGFADLPEDTDGVLRRSLLLGKPPQNSQDSKIQHLCNDPQGDDLFSFAFQLSYLYLQSLPDPVPVEPTQDFKIKMGDTIVDRLIGSSGGYQTSGDNMGTYSILIDYRNGKSPSQIVTLGDLLNDKVDPKLVENKIVLIGYDSIAIPDTKLTPYSGGSQDEKASMLGVAVHAQVVSQLLGIALDGQKPIGYLPQSLEWFWIISWSVIGGLITFRKFKQLWLVGLINLGLIGCLILIVRIMMTNSSLWLPFPPALLALVFTTVITTLIDRVPTVQKMLKISIEIDWDQVRKEADKLVSISGQVSPLSSVEEIDLEQAEKKAKQTYLEELQTRAKQRRKKKYTPPVAEQPVIAPVKPVDTQSNILSQMQGKITQLKERLSSRRGKPEVVIEKGILSTQNTTSSSQTIEQQVEMQELERYIEEVLHHARTINSLISNQ